MILAVMPKRAQSDPSRTRFATSTPRFFLAYLFLSLTSLVSGLKAQTCSAFDGTYTNTLQQDGFTVTENDTVSGTSVTALHTFTNGNSSGSFSWTGTIDFTSPASGTITGQGTIDNVGVRQFTLGSGSIVLNPDGSAQLSWSAVDPVFGPIGGFAFNLVNFTGTYTSVTQMSDFTHTENDTVSGNSVTALHTFTNGTVSGSFSWTGTIGLTSATSGTISGQGTIDNAGVRQFTLSSGSIVLQPNRDAQLFWLAVDPVFGPIGGSAERPRPTPQGCNRISFVDPVPSLFTPGTWTIPSDPSFLASGGIVVSGAAADGVTQVVVRLSKLSGQQITVDLLDEFGNSAPGNGEDGMLQDLFSAGAGTTVSPTIQTVNGENMAFLVYQAPLDFRRTDADNGLSSRQLSIRISDTVGKLASTVFFLKRPPILFIHGLWSGPSTWNQLDAAIRAQIPGLATYRVDYGSTNGDSVSLNTPIALLSDTEQLSAFKSQHNVAAAQMDFIVHSMGGLIANNMDANPLFKVPSNYGQGRIHKLITIDTPYKGSPWANALNQSSASCQSLLASAGNPVDGAIQDLAIGSQFYSNFNPAPSDYYKHAIAAVVNQTQSAQASQAVNTITASDTATGVILAPCDSVFTPPVPQFSFDSFFGEANDLIVSQSSQLGPFFSTVGEVATGFAHLNLGTTLPFFGNIGIPGVLTSGDVATRVVDLLNTSVSDGSSFEH